MLLFLKILFRLERAGEQNRQGAGSHSESVLAQNESLTSKACVCVSLSGCFKFMASRVDGDLDKALKNSDRGVQGSALPQCPAFLRHPEQGY